jgi:FkbM family methyltransferase
MRGDVGWNGPLVSFEPLSEAFHALKTAAVGDANWQVVNSALGDKDEETQINLAGNSQSSSLLEMLPSHAEAAPSAIYQGREKITVRRLDSVFSDYCRADDSLYLKIDTQGFESRVLHGAEKSLGRVKVLQLELSIVPLYRGQLVATEMISYLQARGFVLSNLEPVFKDKRTEALLQADGLFFRPQF